MANTILIIIIALLIFGFVVERILDFLNSTFWSDQLPQELEGIYDSDKYKKSQDYERVNHKFSTITATISFIAMLLMLLFNGFAWVDNLVRQYTVNPILMALLFFGLLGFASDILSTPFSIYGTFVIEEKFGFNRTTVKTFILDKIKGLFLGAIIGGGLLALIIWIYESTGPYFWMIAWAAITLFMLFMTMFYSTLIVPLFNKQTPLQEGELRSAIQSFSKSVGFKLKDIYVIDGSKRSGKANAYFSGIGAKKRIVLYDTLIEDHTTSELVAVLAHEIGHYKKKHTQTGMLLSILQTGLMLFILSLFISKPMLSQALGASEGSFHLGILAFGILYSPISMILGLFDNILSRKNEYQADRFAGVNYDPEALQLALKKLSVNNLSNLRPHPAYVFVHYSHPPVLKRLEALDKIKK
ncbi:MAG: M48 family metallopeptidase [Bacteroidales bacterium]|nr:M48 family metallopeptidase [Bacteroidales bacterium]